MGYDNSSVKGPKCDVVIALVMHFPFFVTLCHITQYIFEEIKQLGLTRSIDFYKIDLTAYIQILTHH